MQLCPCGEKHQCKMDSVLNRIAALLSELNNRLQDGSLMNADIPDYSVRINAAIVNATRMYQQMHHHRVAEVIQGLQDVSEALQQQQQFDSRFSGDPPIAPTREYRGTCIIIQVYFTVHD